jgi:hypothetical protein
MTSLQKSYEGDIIRLNRDRTKKQNDIADALLKDYEERLKSEEELKKAEEELWISHDREQKERDAVLHKEVNKLQEASLKHREETIISTEFRKDVQRKHILSHRSLYQRSDKERLSEHLEQFTKECIDKYIENDQNSITQNSRVELLRMGLSIDNILRLGNDPRILSQIVKQRENEEKRYKSSVLQLNTELLNDIKMKGQIRWHFIASENDHFPYDPIPIGAELRYGAGENWFYKTMTQDMKGKHRTSHDSLGLDRDIAPGIVKQLEIHQKYTGNKWVPIITT